MRIPGGRPGTQRQPRHGAGRAHGLPQLPPIRVRLKRGATRAGADLPEDLRPVPRSVDDVDVTELDDGIWSLRLPLPYRATPSVNAYLLAGAGGCCLVDCGTSMDLGWAALERALALTGVAPSEVRALICTHLHADHAGLAATVVQRTGCALLRGLGAHTVDDALRDPAIPLEARRRAGRRAGIPEAEVDLWVDTHLADDVRHERIDPDRLLVEGDVLALRSGGWRVVPARGHSPTQICLYEEQRRWLISADLVYPVAEPFLEYGYTLDPYGEHLASLRRAAALGPAKLLPGHGRPLADAPERIEAAVRAAEALAPAVKGVLRNGPRTAYEVVVGMLTDTSEHNRRQSMLSIALCVLEHLQGRGEITARLGDDGTRRFCLA